MAGADHAGTGPEPSARLDELKWGHSPQEADDLGLASLLMSLQLLADDKDRAGAVGASWTADTPASVQAIKSGATAITRAMTKWVGGAGGVAAALSAGAAVVVPLVGHVGQAVVVALIGSAALLGSGVAIACALLISGDLRARGEATAARHAGRAEVASAFLRATATTPMMNQVHQNDILFALSSFPGKVRLIAKGDSHAELATGIRTQADHRVQIGTKSGDWKFLDEIEGYTTNP
ncbi:hypothetical protein [Krasilnikovia sp. MM14-A1004]|uniref:hypothetical protein n=1 Tax=Krasilnikovia sp. MM14-A1004 TaxID=3373541 RepID=UPI00399CE277